MSIVSDVDPSVEDLTKWLSQYAGPESAKDYYLACQAAQFGANRELQEVLRVIEGFVTKPTEYVALHREIFRARRASLDYISNQVLLGIERIKRDFKEEDLSQTFEKIRLAAESDDSNDRTENG